MIPFKFILDTLIVTGTWDQYGMTFTVTDSLGNDLTDIVNHESIEYHIERKFTC
jgi:hypothetical protein